MLTISLLIYYTSEHVPPSLISGFNIMRLKSLSDTKGYNSHPMIFVLGTSLTRNAFYKDKEMESFAIKNGFKMRFLRFTRSSSKLSDFKELTEYLLKAKPDLICFESTLFTENFDKNRMNLKWKFEEHHIYLKKLLKEYLIWIKIISLYKIYP
jgi:hypothetical protein